MTETEYEIIESAVRNTPRLKGAKLKKLYYGNDISVELTMPNGKKYAFPDLASFNNFEARLPYLLRSLLDDVRLEGPPLSRISQHLHLDTPPVTPTRQLDYE